MSPLLDLMAKGGPAIIAIMVLSVVLYARCFTLLLSLRRYRGRLRAMQASLAHEPEDARRLQQEIRESFRQQRVALAAMIAASPLLGLLGTVSGMVKTFESLSLQAGEKSMEGLARGISEVLVSTESGLLVALPAALLVYLGHREVLKHVRMLNRVEPPAGEGAPS